MQLLGPGYRDTGRIDAGRGLPGERLQHEVACPMIQSRAATIEPGGEAAWTFFGLYEPDHPEASGEPDLERVERVRLAAGDFAAGPAAPCPPAKISKSSASTVR